MGDEDDEAPEIELGEGPPVEGAPLARVVSRLSWPRAKSAVIEQEGETAIRTAEGPVTLTEILEDVDTSYFATSRDFVHDVREIIGYGPVQTAE